MPPPRVFHKALFPFSFPFSYSLLHTHNFTFNFSISFCLFVCFHCSFSFYFDLIRFFFLFFFPFCLFFFSSFASSSLPLLFLSFFYCPMSHPFFVVVVLMFCFLFFSCFYSLHISRHDISRKKVRFECLTFIFILLFFSLSTSLKLLYSLSPVLFMSIHRNNNKKQTDCHICEGKGVWQYSGCAPLWSYLLSFFFFHVYCGFIAPFFPYPLFCSS